MLLREYAAKFWSGLQLLEQYRLGPTPVSVLGVPITPAFERALRTANWYADGIIQAPDKTIIIEAKVKPNPSAIGQVLFYQRLALATPLLLHRLNLPVVPMVLFGEEDRAVSQFAVNYGVTVATYSPAWIVDYLQSVQLRNRTTSLGEPREVAVETDGTPEA